MSDWIMVIITAVSVIATIIMAFLNYKSYDIARKQMMEMMTQYEEQKIISSMPCLQVKCIEDPPKINGKTTIILLDVEDHKEIVDTDYNFVIKNIGGNIAKEISYHWNSISENTMDLRIVSLANEDERYINVRFVSPCDTKIRVFSPSITIKYKDIYNNTYNQTVFFTLHVHNSIIELLNVPSTAPEIVENNN